MARAKWAVIFGKFRPPHIGHQYMIELATILAERVTVFVGNPLGPPGVMTAEMRGGWLRETFGSRIEVVVPPEGDLSHLDAAEIVEMGKSFFISQFGQQKPNLVIGGDSHTQAFAEIAECDCLITDTILTRASTIVRDPYDHWDEIIPAARPFFLNEIVLLSDDGPLPAELEGKRHTCIAVDEDDLALARAKLIAARKVADVNLIIRLRSASRLAELGDVLQRPRAGSTSIFHAGALEGGPNLSGFGSTTDLSDIDQSQRGQALLSAMK